MTDGVKEQCEVTITSADNLDHLVNPQHYRHGKVEAIDVIDAAVPHLLRLGPADNGRSQRIAGS